MRWRGAEVPPVARGQRPARFFTADVDGMRRAGTRPRCGGRGRVAARMPESCQADKRTEFEGD